jgi:hypothetical protein
MLRSIVAVVLGYLVMFVLIFATFSAAYLAMGADKAFQPGSYETSGLWLVTSFALGSVAAVVAGFVCAAVARRGSRAPVALIVVVLVIGALSAVPVLLASEGEPKERGGNVSNLEAMQNAKQPGWVALLNPIVGAAGVALGARLKRGREGA